jgi:hypothetical protein
MRILIPILADEGSLLNTESFSKSARRGSRYAGPCRRAGPAPAGGAGQSAAAGRYMIKTVARQLDTAHQQVASQYRILTG